MSLEMRLLVHVFALVFAMATVGVASAQVAPGELGPVVLGATADTFDQVLGGPALGSVLDTAAGTRYYLLCPSGLKQFSVGFREGANTFITWQPCDTTPSPAEARLVLAQQYMPGDAVAGQQFASQAGRQAQAFSSESLASAASADLFMDCNGNLLEPGTFAVALTTNGWTLALGTCL